MTSSGLIGKFNIKKSNSIESSFFEKFSYFFVFLCHLETSLFSDHNSVIEKPNLVS